jgi:hypothetical protein
MMLMVGPLRYNEVLRRRACNYSVTATQIPVASDSDRKVTPAIKQTHIQVEALEPTVSRRLVRTLSYGGIWQQHIASAFCLIVDIVLSPETAPVSLRERKVVQAIPNFPGAEFDQAQVACSASPV